MSTVITAFLPSRSRLRSVKSNAPLTHYYAPLQIVHGEETEDREQGTGNRGQEAGTGDNESLRHEKTDAVRRHRPNTDR